jgi:peptide/nickel transport system permease protein
MDSAKSLKRDDAPTTALPERRPNVFAWFMGNARWYGTEWWITILGGCLLLFIVAFTVLAHQIAPYDPIKFVGAPFASPGARQVIVVRDGETAVQGIEGLLGQRLGIKTNTQAGRELEALGLEAEDFLSFRRASQALVQGQIDAVVVEQRDRELRRALADGQSGIQVVGQPFGTRFVLGTDNFGRDVYSRMIHGARTVLGIAILSALLSALVGVPMGLISGFAGGLFDKVVSLIMDSIYSFPGLILAIAMAALLGPGLLNISIAIAVVYIPTYFRMVRGKVLSVKEEVYVEAAYSLGARAHIILARYVFPNVVPSIAVIFSLNVADSILTEAGLSFLGLGLPPPTPDWGFDLSAARRYLPSGYWWTITFPGLMIALVTLAFSMLGEGLNEILNPRLTET